MKESGMRDWSALLKIIHGLGVSVTCAEARYVLHNFKTDRIRD